MPPQVLAWADLPDLSGVAALAGLSVDAVRNELSALPEGITGLAACDEPGGVVEAIGLLVDREIASHGRRSLVRVYVHPGRPPGRGLALVDHVEHEARSRGARHLRVSIAGAPGLNLLLQGRGYHRAESFLHLRLAATPRQVTRLPTALRERLISEVPVAAFLAMSNHAFAGVPGAIPLTEEDWARLVASPDYDPDFAAVLESDQGLLGFYRGSLSAAPNGAIIGEIEALGLLPQARGRKLGRWLLRRCQERLLARGATEIELTVASTNIAALALYTAEGFTEVSRRETWERWMA